MAKSIDQTVLDTLNLFLDKVVIPISKHRKCIFEWHRHEHDCVWTVYVNVLSVFCFI